MDKCGVFYLSPHREPKVWGKAGIGEYWYGAEKGKASTAETPDGLFPADELLRSRAEDLLGKEAVRRFGPFIPLVKILTPKSRLSVQFHEKKDELWVVTGIDRNISGEEPEIILGFSDEALEKWGEDVPERYREELERFGGCLNELIALLEEMPEGKRFLECGDVQVAAEKAKGLSGKVDEKAGELRAIKDEVDLFYNHVRVREGDVIPVPNRTLHALGAGIEVVEPQIPGTTQSTEDGATYPVRYYFPGFSRPGAGKMLDIERTGELRAEKPVKTGIELVRETEEIRIERLPGGFEEKGLAVHRITIQEGRILDNPAPGSLHILTAVKGNAVLETGDGIFRVPLAEAGGRMLVIPACSGGYTLRAIERTQLIDTFIPV